jgi:hypothetical protein
VIAFAGVMLALLDETVLGGAGERLVVFAYSFELARLSKCGAGGKCTNQRYKKNALHHFPPSFGDVEFMD